MNTAHQEQRSGHSPRRRHAARPDAAQPASLRRPRDLEVRVRLRGVGSMAVGAVEAIGAHAVGFARGDRVVFPLGRDERAAVDLDADGGLDALLVGSERLLGVPKDVTDEQAARLLAPGLAARVLLKQLRQVRAGDRVLVALEAVIPKAVVAAWATALGATVVAETEAADVLLDEEALRQAHGLAFRRGHLQAGSADVFAAIRNGVFDEVLPTGVARAAA